MTILFDSTIIKIDKKGNQIPSTTLKKGEKLLTGETYREVVERLERTAVNEGGWTRIESDDEPLDAATLDPSGTSTISRNEYDAVEEKQAEIEAQRERYIPESEKSVIPRPSDHDDKEAWYEYARSKGFSGDYEKTTKATFIETYGN